MKPAGSHKRKRCVWVHRWCPDLLREPQKRKMMKSLMSLRGRWFRAVSPSLMTPTSLRKSSKVTIQIATDPKLTADAGNSCIKVQRLFLFPLSFFCCLFPDVLVAPAAADPQKESPQSDSDDCIVQGPSERRKVSERLTVFAVKGVCGRSLKDFLTMQKKVSIYSL